METVTMSLEKYDELKRNVEYAELVKEKEVNELKNALEKKEDSHAQEIDALKATYEAQLSKYKNMFSLKKVYDGKISLSMKVHDAACIFNDLFANSEYRETHEINTRDYSESYHEEVAEYYIYATSIEEAEDEQ